ncbi:nucleotidyl transferase AbiEii/AbiGii toxin family protein [Conexibacter sp. W3-3-2]|uniref:nucleotidyl transferase AbiEii/AbiGii toxin family protein n=1 Tax=Conexibacter sp. W3-3-2 TaxID=2675227 RepID=UPI0018A8CE26|nr:nucleotidyl transferase AbiEii/AbiGii toxin family protein [Conexibacter sp. W3-3-2]
MTLLRENFDDFDGAVGLAAERTGYQPIFIEKDYWVCQVLRVLCGPEGYGADVVFKGGTSVSKGYALIDRFSEDVDILVQKTEAQSRKECELLLEQMSALVAGRLGLDRHEARPPGRGKWPHRADILSYPSRLEAPAIEGVIAGGVQLETGYAGGEWPSQGVEIAPLLMQAEEVADESYEDLESFRVRALLPVRTLLEKLSVLHHVGAQFVDASTANDGRFGRHYYDVFQILGYADTLARLADREAFVGVVEDVRRISSNHYGGSTPRPDGGYADSPAFAAPPGSDLRDYLEDNYERARALAARDAVWPSLGAILKRVAEYRDLL